MNTFSKEEREALMTEFQASGLTGADFCKLKGIKKTTFYSWKQIERKANLPKQNKDFIKVNHHLDAILSPKLILEKDGWKITLPNDPATIRTIFNALGLIHAD